MNLLERAIQVETVRTVRGYPQQEIDLAIAWMRRRVTDKQVATVLRLSQGSIAQWMAHRMRHAYELGQLVLQD